MTPYSYSSYEANGPVTRIKDLDNPDTPHWLPDFALIETRAEGDKILGTVKINDPLVYTTLTEGIVPKHRGKSRLAYETLKAARNISKDLARRVEADARRYTHADPGVITPSDF